ncbi:MAG: PAS domain-containing protein [Gammaproteobacteria bacterium]|nr:PAS domain-containing protein [Gammaproteobacteria bacterium]
MTHTDPTPRPPEAEIESLRRRLRRAQARNAALERQLQETEQYWRFILENGPDIVFIVDEGLRIRFINRTPAGMDPEEALGTPVLDYVAAEHRAEVRDKIRRVIATGEAQTFEIAARGPEGSVACYSTYLGPARRKGHTEGVILVTRDITRLKEAEEAARQRELELTAVTDNLPVLIAYVDAAERYRFNSRGFQTWFGLEPRKIHGMHLKDVVGEAGYAEITPYVRQALSGTRTSFEDIVHYARGGTRHVEATYVPDFGASGQVRGFVAVIADITERKRAEEAARLHREELAHASRINVAGEMVSALAHELTQPLTAIEHYAAFALAGVTGNTTHPAADAVHKLEREAQRAGNIIRQLREFVRKGRTAKRRIDLNRIVTDAIQLIAPSARSKGISLELEATPEPLAVLADNIQIEQVLVNLIQNSIDAIDAFAPAVRQVRMRTQRIDGWAQATVRDTGGGIDPARGERIFDIFETTKAQGMGVGLSISRSIVEAHGGRLWHEAGCRSGAVFHFHLPLSQDTP